MSNLAVPIPQQVAQKKDANGKRFLIFALMLLVVLTFTAIQPLIPNDFFPYLRIGQEILRTGALPTTEFMTYTSYGNPALYLYWLPSLIFLAIYQAGGVLLTTLAAMICVGSFFFLMWKSLEELGISSLTSGFVLILISLIAASFFSPRPQVLALPLFGLSLWLILLWQNGKDQFLWLLPVISLLWVNLHGSFIVLFLLLIPAIVFGAGNRRRLIILTVLAFLATFVNAYTYQIWSNMFSVVANQSNQLFGMEWRPLSNQGWQWNILFGLLLLIPLLATFSKTKVKWLYWIWFLGFGWMALSSVRYVIWFLPILALVLCTLINAWVEKLAERFSNRLNQRGLNLILGSVMLAFPLLLLPGVRTIWWQNSPPAYNDSTPIKAVEWLRQNPDLPGNLWTDFSFSTYLTYALPDRKLFTTNRIEDFTPAQLEDYISIAGGAFDWETILQKYSIRLVMPSRAEQPELVKALSTSANWRQVYDDTHAIIFVRES
jgi:hypothetical protein